MTPAEFNEALADLKSAGVIESDADAARQLGVHRQTIRKRRAEGADRETELALLALYARLDKPF